MSAITRERLNFMPFEYQWAYDYWFNQQNAHWMFQEINMQKDIKDWHEELSEDEKKIIGNILKGFAQTETAVNDYWTQYVTKWFPVPEIKMMATTFGSFETIHARAYAYLNEILGLDDFKAFMDDKATMDRLEQLINIPIDSSLRDIAKSLAIFSACAEGVSLFSQFAILLSFRQKNLLTGISQQMIYSCRDESLHSEAGCKLFRELIKENPQINTEDFRSEIMEAFDEFITKELDYLDSIFGENILTTITKESLIEFIFDRANKKLEELGIAKNVYQVNKKELRNLEWFYPMISGTQSTDFFANKETGYSKAGEDWNSEEEFF